MNSFVFTVLFIHLCCLTLLINPFIICTGSSEILCISSECETLLNFKNHLKDPSNRLSSWNATVNTNCCEWEGVVCSNVIAHVVELHLNISPPSDEYDEVEFEVYERSQFGGEINPCLVDLKHLNHLDLSGNNFGGMQIPTFIATITSLTYLNLSYAGFSGKIPHQIGNLSNLLYLDLRSDFYFHFSRMIWRKNEFNGEIPYQIGNLSKLVHLDIGGSYRYKLSLFAKNIHWLSGLSSLQYLNLGLVNLSKSFDWLQVTQTLLSLVELHLSSCPLGGYNQPSTVNFSSLVTLDLSYSYALGTSSFPEWICGQTNLVSLQLKRNNIEGPIPDGLQNLTLLENLDLSSNSFSSSIPDMLGNMTSLVVLDLSSIQFEGKISTSLGNLCNLRELSLSNLKLNQQVNEIFEILTPCVSHRLKALYIGSSRLSGHLTNQIGVFKNLVQLNFYNNSIHGALPRSFGKLSSLRYLDLSNNQFNGNPFERLRSLSKLSHLYIDDNLFQGVVKEDDLANLTNLSSFSASGNNFSLKVGPNWNPSFQLKYLAMSSWNLGPKFPSWIRSQKSLDYLEMSNTGISDFIPTWLWDGFSQAGYVNLSHNHIHGELANTSKNSISTYMLDLSSNNLSGQLHQLSVDMFNLDLSNNWFSGSITELLCKKPNEPMQLEFLNLASNNLSGEIPDCWLMWPYLVDVKLQRNHFVGNLPPSVGSLVWLESLQIHNNKLSGNFPPALKNNNKLISLDLGENRFIGIIPAWIGERLVSLKILRLRSNKFFSHIPNQICALHFLQVLDLAQNNLSGNIPNCFNHLNAMMLQNRSIDPFIHCDAVNGSRNSMVSVLLWLKGREDEYGSILGLVTSIDLSSNNLSGEIPREITYLDGLSFLNLSYNQLTGHIPKNIGNMRWLESINFSRNKLVGEIPSTISNLSFLSMLDLSYNHLKGKIPTSTQLQTFEASKFIDNDLCGLPLPNDCISDVPNLDDGHNVKENEGHRLNYFFMSMAFGFVLGFWVVVAPLFIYRSWRCAYFRFLDHMWFKVWTFW